RVVALAGYLVDLVDVDDAALRSLDVVIGVLQERDDDVLDVLADVAGLGEVGGVGDGERDVDDASEGLREQRLAGAGRPEQEDVRLLKLDLVVLTGHPGARAGPGPAGRFGVDALVVVVHRDGQDLLGALLADDVLVENLLDGLRLGDVLPAVGLLLLLDLLGDDVVAQPDALIADVDRRPRDELLHLLLRLAAEGAGEVGLPAVSLVRHDVESYPAPRYLCSGLTFFCTITSSTIPYSLASPGPMK